MNSSNSSKAKAPDKIKLKKGKANRGGTELLAGLGFGAYGGITLATVGTICPACVIAAPLFLATRIYKRIQNSKDHSLKTITEKPRELQNE